MTTILDLMIRAEHGLWPDQHAQEYGADSLARVTRSQKAYLTRLLEAGNTVTGLAAHYILEASNTGALYETDERLRSLTPETVKACA